MFPGMPKMPGEDFVNSIWPIVIALGLGLILGVRYYFRGTKCPSRERVDGKVVIVTGADGGIGFETAKDLASRGARMILACRDEEKAKHAIELLKATVGEACAVYFLKLDLTSFQSVRDFVTAFSAKESHLDILINNAGIMCHPQAKTADGFEIHFQTNFLGPFLLTHLLLEKLKAAPNGSRIINVTAHAYQLGELVPDDLQFEEREYKPGDAYAQSKLAILLYTRRLARHLENTKVTVNAVNPGVARTNIHRHMPFRKSAIVSLTFAPFLWFLMKTSFDGAQTSVYCAVAKEEEGVSGKYYVECKMADVDAKAADDEMADKLWDVGFKLCGLPSSE